ncbi:DUF721 domain-containing protein [Subtercola sp. YIM 133946]|uniref:DUF721 domain-containing protein n=1 Tax=Subtercola sp. YIM 133946 TaxID=3118909 RepID=UPI002F942FC1
MAETGDDASSTESRSVYLRFKAVFGDTATTRPNSRRNRVVIAGETVPYGTGREPKGIASVMDGLTTDLGWSRSLAKSDLMLAWKQIAGEETAEHSHPTEITDSVLTVQCDSTAWATQLRLMRTMIMTRIVTEFPDAGIQSIRFLAPDAPSWKRGSRSIPGRGPRDTYG